MRNHHIRCFLFCNNICSNALVSIVQNLKSFPFIRPALPVSGCIGTDPFQGSLFVRRDFLSGNSVSDQPSVFSIENHGQLKKVPNIASVSGTITEVYNGSATLETPDKAVYSVELKPFDTLNKGDRLLVFFTGSVQEIYPGQFENQLGYILLNDL